MAVIEGNTYQFYIEVTQNIQYALYDMSCLISLNNDIHWYSDFSQGYNLQNYKNECYNIKSQLESLEQWSVNSSNIFENTVGNMQNIAYSTLPVREISTRKGIRD